MLSPSLDTELEVVEPLARRTDIEAAGRLRLASDDVMVAMFRRLHEGAPFRTTTTYIPVEIGQSIGGLDFLKQRGARAQTTIIELIERETPTPVAGAHQSITAVAAPPIAAALELQPGAPLLRIDRLYYDLNGTPIYLAVNHFNPDRYSYRMEMRRSPR